MSWPDIPVVCTESGMVMLLEKVVDELVLEREIEKVYKDGSKAEIGGNPCPACRIQFARNRINDNTVVGWIRVEATGKLSCTYRTLRGPLYVPR